MGTAAGNQRLRPDFLAFAVAINRKLEGPSLLDARLGTYVAPHVQTNPNSTQMDDYGTRGNVNPYTGAVGTRTPRY
jgi:hypothetical protein